MADQDQLIMECPEGLELIFYDSLMKVESVLVADYGKLFSNEQQLFVRDNVVFNNQNLDTLFAEELEIDFAKDKFTNSTLKINSLDQLKNKIIKVIIIVLIVKFFEKILKLTPSFTTSIDILYFGISILSICIGYYLINRK